MSNSLSQVVYADFMYLRESVTTFMQWYVMNAQKIDELSEYFSQTNDETVVDILNAGLNDIKNRVQIMKDAEMKRGDQL